MSVIINSQVWISSLQEGSDDAEVELAEGTASVELTDASDEGEVAIHFTLEGESQALVSIYTSRSGALALGLLTQHEAMKQKI